MKRLFAFIACFMLFSFSSPYVLFCGASGQKQKYVIRIPSSGQKTLEDRRETIEVQSSRLEALKKDVAARIAKYQSLLVQVRAALKELNSLSGLATAKLVKVYDTMPAENTAQTLSGLDKKEAVRMILMMNPRKAAAVMAAMSPKESAAISSRILSLGKKIPSR